MLNGLYIKVCIDGELKQYITKLPHKCTSMMDAAYSKTQYLFL